MRCGEQVFKCSMRLPSSNWRSVARLFNTNSLALLKRIEKEHTVGFEQHNCNLFFWWAQVIRERDFPWPTDAALLLKRFRTSGSKYSIPCDERINQQLALQIYCKPLKRARVEKKWPALPVKAVVQPRGPLLLKILTWGSLSWLIVARRLKEKTLTLLGRIRFFTGTT